MPIVDRRPPTADRRPPTADRRPPTADRRPGDVLDAPALCLFTWSSIPATSRKNLTLLSPSGRPTFEGMQNLSKTELVGFVELEVGSLAVQVPIRAAAAATELPLASFEAEGDNCAILVRGDTSSKAVEVALRNAAQEAVKHLSKKLLN
ncbi:hypothetical protein [Sorangium cellulosum]|uniref:hypothetical protein n=1 Tax=Sorangium cellulosum TaxID=56 RepID=UPI001E615FF0|nr:hypothetical protein [Sorangium cellulosum]